jgi:CHAT domain-containing protein
MATATGDAAANGLDALLRRCHALLVAPLAKALEGEKHLLVVPDRDLYALPFAALRDAEGRYLIERHSVRVAPSLGTLVELEQRRAADSALPRQAAAAALVVGDPSFAGWTVGDVAGAKHLPQLAGAAEEAEHVEAALAGAKLAVTRLRGADATKARAVAAMRASAVVHLATHGSPDGVFFAGASEAGATLSMAEVHALALPRTRLVVLSECDSFKGELRADGVVGIARAFVAAGAQTLVASLWQVDDQGTLELMRRFYAELVGSAKEGAGPIDAAVALQRAMVAMLRAGGGRAFTPKQWAAFVVYGLAGGLAGPKGERGAAVVVQPSQAQNARTPRPPTGEQQLRPLDSSSGASRREKAKAAAVAGVVK